MINKEIRPNKVGLQKTPLILLKDGALVHSMSQKRSKSSVAVGCTGVERTRKSFL